MIEAPPQLQVLPSPFWAERCPLWEVSIWLIFPVAQIIWYPLLCMYQYFILYGKAFFFSFSFLEFTISNGNISVELGTGTRKFGVDVRSSQSLPKNKRLQMRDLSSRKRETSLGSVRTKSILSDDRSRERKKSIQIDSHDISNKGFDDGIVLSLAWFLCAHVLKFIVSFI